MRRSISFDNPMVTPKSMAVALMIAWALVCVGASADMLHYQARLTDPTTGTPREGLVTMTFSIYDTATGGVPLWTETKDITAADGLINTLLGDTTAFPPNLFDGRELWLGITVAPDTEAIPRQLIASVAYAKRAEEAGNADTLDGQHASDLASAVHDHDAASVNTGTLDETRIPDTIARDTEIVPAVLANDGAGSTLDADLLDGFNATDFIRSTGPADISGSSANPLFNVTQSGTSYAGRFTSADNHGVVGVTASASNSIAGVAGYAGSSGITIVGKHGVLGDTDSGKGVVGVSKTGTGVFGWSTNGAQAVRGEILNASGIGINGINYATSGSGIEVRGQSDSSMGVGVYGETTAATGTTYGVKGKSTSTTKGAGVYGESPYVGVWGTGTGWGVFGAADEGGYSVYGGNPGATGYAGYFSGDVRVVGTLTKTAGSFKIDHPLDPENKYLSHSFVESPDMMNVYNGNVLLDDKGEASVTLPDWFEALNREFRYQLTAIGGPGPNLYIAQEIANNTFQIAGGAPGLKVSWQVTGIRQDPYAEAHRIPVEQDKPEKEKGTYLSPKEYGVDASKSVDRGVAPAPAE